MKNFKFGTKSRFDSGFDAGVLYAAGWLIAAHDRPELAKELLGTNGFNNYHLRLYRAQIEPYERNVFKEAGFFKKETEREKRWTRNSP